MHLGPVFATRDVIGPKLSREAVIDWTVVHILGVSAEPSMPDENDGIAEGNGVDHDGKRGRVSKGKVHF